MAFKFNIGSQVIGDLVSADDPQRNTKIDFGNDQINFVVSGTIVASITPNQFSASFFAGDGSSLTNISGGGAGGSGDITSVTAGTNLTGGGTSGAVTLNLAESISLTTITASNWVGLPPSISSDFFTGQFGDGADGDLTVVGTFTAAREMHFNNLTIPTGATFKPNGHRIFVSNTLSIAAGTSFNDDGNNATNQAGGLALASRNYLVAASGQGSNGIALTAVNWSNATAGSNSTNSSPNNLNQAANGGKGGNVTLRSNFGGAGGTAAQALYSQKWNGAWQTARWSGGGFGGGAGGGGGAINVTVRTSGTFTSGGGGGGGGIVWIAAKNISNLGRISANGGKGADGVLAVGTAECAGGGSGGGGNVCIITKTALSSLGTVQANAGVAGISAFNTGTGVETNGTTGNAGSLCIIVLS
jgi:hypothetical protein